MTELKNYMDSTYLKLPQQSGLSEEETFQKVIALCEEAIENDFFAVMIRPEYVKRVKSFLNDANSHVVVGTVIGFHEGDYSTQEKLTEAQQAIDDQVDELDFVINYNAFKSGDLDLVKKEVALCNDLALKNGKVIKWIIEAAALSDQQIAEITKLIKEVTMAHHADKATKVFVKSSTGFYQTPNGEPNGATPHNIKIMIAHAGKLPVKAAGGVRNAQEARDMIALGVQRIGTSSAQKICNGEITKSDY